MTKEITQCIEAFDQSNSDTTLQAWEQLNVYVTPFGDDGAALPEHVALTGLHIESERTTPIDIFNADSKNSCDDTTCGVSCKNAGCR